MKNQTDLHESFAREEAAHLGSERAFGIVFAIVFLIVALWPLSSGSAVRVWALLTAGAFAALALMLPAALRPLNRIWFTIGVALHRVASPLVLGMLFYLTVLPTGLVMRALGKDPLRLRFDRNARSYWIERTPPGPAPDSLRNQF